MWDLLLYVLHSALQSCSLITPIWTRPTSRSTGSPLQLGLFSAARSCRPAPCPDGYGTEHGASGVCALCGDADICAVLWVHFEHASWLKKALILKTAGTEPQVPTVVCGARTMVIFLLNQPISMEMEPGQWLPPWHCAENWKTTQVEMLAASRWV